jgi:hypothetical protein
MKTVIGLLWSEEGVQSSTHKLKEFGVDEDAIFASRRFRG